MSQKFTQLILDIDEDLTAAKKANIPDKSAEVMYWLGRIHGRLIKAYIAARTEEQQGGPEPPAEPEPPAAEPKPAAEPEPPAAEPKPAAEPEQQGDKAKTDAAARRTAGNSPW